MAIDYNQVVCRVDTAALVANYRLLSAGGANPWPVIKADAYGHGLHACAEALARAGATTMCVGTMAEAARLAGAFQGRVVALLGALTPDDEELAVRHGLVGLVGSFAQLRSLNRAASGHAVPGSPDGRLEIALKFDTGMSRLGFAKDQIPELLAVLAECPALRVGIVCSHLATADEPDPAGDAYFTQQQATFASIVESLRAAGLSFEASLANSAALMGRPTAIFDAQRPGIALYGANPFFGTPRAELGAALKPVMAVHAPLITVREIAAGQSVSYGCTYTAQRAMRIAVVGAGYADNYSRALSNRGQMCLHGQRAPILGRVCMQLTMIDVSHIPQAAPGDRVWLLGGEGPESGGAIRGEELAAWCGTIPYEIFCLLGQNPREYVS